jgi:hypothetical protein
MVFSMSMMMIQSTFTQVNKQECVKSAKVQEWNGGALCVGQIYQEFILMMKISVVFSNG